MKLLKIEIEETRMGRQVRQQMDTDLSFGSWVHKDDHRKHGFSQTYWHMELLRLRKERSLVQLKATHPGRSGMWVLPQFVGSYQ